MSISKEEMDEMISRYPDEKPVAFNYMKAREDVFRLINEYKDPIKSKLADQSNRVSSNELMILGQSSIPNTEEICVGYMDGYVTLSFSKRHKKFFIIAEAADHNGYMWKFCDEVDINTLKTFIMAHSDI